jgi:GntR family transcriptional regulator
MAGTPDGLSDERGGEPKYRRIANDLTAAIRAGTYAAGAALPAQRALSESYGVTLMTLRQALQVLESEGLIEQRPGRGTFVLPADISHSLQNLRSLADEMDAQGVQIRTDVLGRSIRRLPRSVADELRLADAPRGLRLERLRSVRGRPILYQMSWIPEPWAEQIRDVDFERVALYSALAAECGKIAVRAEEMLSAQTLAPQLAASLSLETGLSVLIMRRLTFDGSDQPFVVDIATVLDPRLRVTAERHSLDSSAWSLR